MLYLSCFETRGFQKSRAKLAHGYCQDFPERKSSLCAPPHLHLGLRHCDTAGPLDDERLYKTSRSGVYVQNLHSNKSFDVNIGKMASYALKSATRYKHSFISNDVGNELMLQSELAGLIDLYDQIQKRNWRALMFTHSIGSRQVPVLSNKEADSSD